MVGAFPSRYGVGQDLKDNGGEEFALKSDRAPVKLYVSLRGSWTEGCTQKSPCREIERALSLAVPGDTIIIADEEFPGFDIPGFRASASKPLTITGPGRRVRILPNENRKDARDNIHILDSDWIVLDGLISLNAPRAGIRVDNSHHITIKNSTFADNGTWGIFANHSNDLLIENNECYGSHKQHGIYVSNSSDFPVIRGNRLYNNRMAGIHLNGDVNMGGGRGVQPDGIVSGALVENNIIFSNGKGGGAGINMDGVQDSVIRNNLLYDNHAAGLTAYAIDGAEGPKNVMIYNNTIDMAPDGRWAVVVHKTAGPVIIMNNILYNRNASRGGLSIGTESDFPKPLNFLSRMGVVGNNRDLANVHSDYNIYGGGSGMATLDDNESRYSLSQWQKTENDRHSMTAALSDLFADTAKRDYRLKAGSPALDRGISLDAVKADIVGTKRPAGRGADIGAFEL